MSDLASQIATLGVTARAAAGAPDVAHLKRMKLSCRVAELAGRLLLHFALGPWTWALGTLLVAYELAVEAQLNHSIMHGAFVGLPGAGRFVPSRYETLAIPFRSKTWRDAHRIHHAHPSILEQDPDTVHPLFRMHDTQARRRWHRFNAFLGAFFTFEHWAFDYDAFLKRGGHRPRGDRGEWKKLAAYAGYQFVLFPVLAGAHWRSVLAAGVVAAIIRNLIFTGLQTASSVGHEVSTRHAVGRRARRGTERLRFQIETSKNFVIGPIARVLCGGLDRHIEHHLFPHLPPRRLYALSAPVKALCEASGIAYSEHRSFRASLRDSLSYLHSLSR